MYPIFQNAIKKKMEFWEHKESTQKINEKLPKIPVYCKPCKLVFLYTFFIISAFVFKTHNCYYAQL